MKGAQNRRCLPNVEPEVLVDADLDTLATALHVRTDDLLKDNPHRIPWRPKVGIAPVISDAEMVTLSVRQPLLEFTSEARWLGSPASTCATCSRTCPSSQIGRAHA